MFLSYARTRARGYAFCMGDEYPVDSGYVMNMTNGYRMARELYARAPKELKNMGQHGAHGANPGWRRDIFAPCWGGCS